MKYNFNSIQYYGSTARSGKKWSINEILRLEREWELLGYSVIKIADLHQRTPKSIYYKLAEEEIADYNEIESRIFNDIEVQYIEDECEEMDDEFNNKIINVDDMEIDINDNYTEEEIQISDTLNKCSINIFEDISPPPAVLLAPSILPSNIAPIFGYPVKKEIKEENIEEPKVQEKNIFINFFNNIKSHII